MIENLVKSLVICGCFVGMMTENCCAMTVGPISQNREGRIGVEALSGSDSDTAEDLQPVRKKPKPSEETAYRQLINSDESDSIVISDSSVASSSFQSSPEQSERVSIKDQALALVEKALNDDKVLEILVNLLCSEDANYDDVCEVYREVINILSSNHNDVEKEQRANMIHAIRSKRSFARTGAVDPVLEWEIYNAGGMNPNAETEVQEYDF